MLGKSGVLTGADATSFETPVAGPRLPSFAVLRPRSTEEVAAAVKYCGENRIAIIPQGGNTNVCRMTVPLPGQTAVILSLSRMNRILDVDPECSTLTVEAGATLQQVQEAAAEAGRLFAPDWGARGTAQIGGAVATNGGGLNVLRYGTTREQVLGMEVVLADGRVWDGSRALIKDNSGYDLKQLFIGSEGTLGIITKVVFKLHPAPVHTCSMMAVLTDSARLMDCLNLAKKVAGHHLVAFELLDGLGIELALKRYPDLKRPLEERADWYILIRLGGGEPVDGIMQLLFERSFEDAIFSDAVLAQSEAQERNLWEIREQMIPTQYFSGQQIKWDVSVPISRMVDFLTRADTVARTHSREAVPYAVGHVGDGNIHYSIFLPGVPADQAEKLARAYVEEIDSLIWSMGGSIVAEHGVGTAYRERVRRQKSTLEYEMMQRLRTLFDPEGILNPGKLLDDLLLSDGEGR
jgi:FAD/FMN-containing dehydrogenase